MASLQGTRPVNPRLLAEVVDPHAAVERASPEVSGTALRDEIEAWVNEGGAGDDVEP